MGWFGKRSKSPIIKKIEKLYSKIQKDKKIDSFDVRSRQEILVSLFESKLRILNLEPSLESDYMPTAKTPLATFLLEHGVDKDTVNAIISELKDLPTKAEVESIIDAVAEIPGIHLRKEDVQMAKHLALDEWIRMKK